MPKDKQMERERIFTNDVAMRRGTSEDVIWG